MNEVTQSERPGFFRNAGSFFGVWIGVAITIGITNRMYMESVAGGYANTAYALIGCVAVSIMVSVLLYQKVKAKQAAAAGLLVGWTPFVSQVIKTMHAAA